MRITFIQPYYHNIWESLGIGYIVDYLKRKMDNIEINFFHGNFDKEDDIIKGSIDSDVVAFSCTTPTYEKGRNIAERIVHENKDIKIVFGGWHPTVARKIGWDDLIDHVIYGEGEKLLYNLLKGDTLKYKTVRYTRHPILFKDLYWPDREVIRQDRTLDLCEEMCGERIASFQSRRGCPFDCSICGERCMSEKGVRVRDPIDLLAEIEFVRNMYKITKFKFVDPTWCFPKSAAIEFCELKQNNLPWEAMIHASYIDKELLRVMKYADCQQVNVGCESGSQKVLNSMRKGLSVGKLKKVFEWGHQVGLEMRAFFIIGLPEETKEDIEMTKDLIREIEPDHLGVTILAPYPGSDYYEEDKFKDVDWSEVDEYSNDIWSTKHFTNQQLKDTQKSFYDEFGDKMVWHQKYFIEE